MWPALNKKLEALVHNARISYSCRPCHHCMADIAHLSRNREPSLFAVRRAPNFGIFRLERWSCAFWRCLLPTLEAFGLTSTRSSESREFYVEMLNCALSSERPARISQAHDKLRRSKLPRYLAGTARCLLNSEAVPTRKPPLPLTHEHVQLSAPENKRKPGPAKTWHCHTPKLCTLITL